MKRSKVYVLDWELLSPLGVGTEALLSNVKKEVSAEKVSENVPVEGLPFKRVAEINEELSVYFQDETNALKDAATCDRKFELTMAVANLLEKKLGNLKEHIPADRAGVIMGVGADVAPFETIAGYMKEDDPGNPKAMLHALRNINTCKKERINVLGNPCDYHAIFIAQKFGLGAFQKSVLTACAASTQAIALAAEEIMSHRADVVFAGGTDSIINSIALMSFGKLGVLSPGELAQEKSCKPFDRNRSGTLAAEAAGLCVLVSERFVQKHNLAVQFELPGYGNSLDAWKITAPDPNGNGMKRAIRQALHHSNIQAADLDYINLHGTGTQANDAVELDAIFEVMGDEARQIPMSSTKDRHGHAIAAAGIQEFCLLLSCMEAGLIPGSLNLEKPLREDMDLIQEGNRNQAITTALSNNFSFGGVNTVIALKKIHK